MTLLAAYSPNMPASTTHSRQPPASSPGVTAQMKRMPRRDTRPELQLRRALHGLGLRFRVNYRGLPGTPDIAFTRARIAVFVDGCFWHRCPDPGVIPKANRQWWTDKLQATVDRDARKDSELKSAGWLPVHVWEHEDPDQAAERIDEQWRGRIHSVPRSPPERSVTSLVSHMPKEPQ